MIGAVSSRPLRFFGLVMLVWIAARFVGLSPVFRPSPPAPRPLQQAGPALDYAATVSALAPSSSSLPPAVPSAPLPYHPLRRAFSTVPGDIAKADFLHFLTTSGGISHHQDSEGPDHARGLTTPTAQPAPLPPHQPAGRWRASAWLLWRRGSGTASGAVAAGQLGGSQAGLRVEYELIPQAFSRAVAYSRLSSALDHPAAPEGAVGLSIQPIRTIPVSFAAERRIALSREARNANAVMMVGGFGPVEVIPAIQIEGYAQTGIVGFRRHDGFIDGKLSAFTRLPDTQIRLGAALSGGAQPHVSRLDIGPEIQLPIPLPQVTARISFELRMRIAGNARPVSGPTVTLATDF